jgi:hypothetical protein
MGYDRKTLKVRLLALLTVGLLFVACQVSSSSYIARSNDPTEAEEVAFALLRKRQTSVSGTEVSDIKQPSVAENSLHLSSKDVASRSEVAVAVDAAAQKVTRAKQSSVPDPAADATTLSTRSDGSDLAIRTEAADAQNAQRDFEIATTPDPDLPTLAYFERAFYSGFRNEGMVFTAFVMYAVENNFTQILLPTIRWKDLYGTNRSVPHEKLFDVIHWNSLYPALPRFVSYNPEAHRELKKRELKPMKWVISDPEKNATRPFAYGRYPKLMNKYKHYTRRMLHAGDNPSLNPVDLAMMRGAFRPHPDLQQHIQRLVGSMDDQTSDDSYMALHARVEPDMQRHPVCRDKKVISLQAIFDSMQTQFPEPPASKLFIAINRPMLEKEGSKADGENQVAVENLAVLNRASMEGLWGGRVKVFEAGMPSIKNTRFEAYPGISGAAVDYFLAVGANLFVGTEVSTFSTDLIAARFYRGNKSNYHYSPTGLQLVTTQNSTVPPRFHC